MKTRERTIINNCQIQLHHNPKTTQDFFNHLQSQTIQLPPLENGEILIKVLYILLDPSVKPLLVGEKENSSPKPSNTDHDPQIPSTSQQQDSTPLIHKDGSGSDSDDGGGRVDDKKIDDSSQSTSSNSAGAGGAGGGIVENAPQTHSVGPSSMNTTQFANYFPPPFSKQQEWIEENNHGSITNDMDPRKVLNYGVLKAYAVGEVVESRNHLFTKGRNVYGNLGVQEYLLSSRGKDLDDNMVRDITMDSPLSAFLTLSKAGMCAYFGVTELANVSENECVFVTGGTGCVGSFVPQIVRASLSDKKKPPPQEGICQEEVEKNHHNIHQKISPSGHVNHSHDVGNGEESSVCSSSHCLIPQRLCNKAKSPTLSWLFNSLIEEENEEEYNLSLHGEDQRRHLAQSSSTTLHPNDGIHSTEEMRHGHHLHPHVHGKYGHQQQHHHHNLDRLNITIPSATSLHKNPPQVNIYGFCSTDARKSMMINKLKYDNAINYSNHMKSSKQKTGETDDSSMGTPVCTSCLTPAWSSISPFSHIYGVSTVSGQESDSCNMEQEKSTDSTCLLKTGQRYDYSNIDRASLSKAIGEMCPDGIDVVFDTVGGVLLDLCLEHLKMNARIVICGAISNTSSSHDSTKESGDKFDAPHNYVNLIIKCARMEGFMVEKFQSKFKQASHTLVRWIQEKKIDNLEENVFECDLKDRPQVINTIGKLFNGDYNGKLIIRVK